MYNLLQDGGVEVQPQISSNDKDFEPVINKLFRLAGVDVIAMSGNEGMYDETEINQLRNEFFVMREDEDNENSLLELIYGCQSRVSYEVFVEAMIKKASFFLSAPGIRKEMWKLAEI